MRISVVAAAGLLLGGCGSLSVHTDWLPEATHSPLPPYHIEIPTDELPLACLNAPALPVHGCAVRMPEVNVCIIYTTPRPAGWVMDHERKHCAGWDHA
jgi:hypothetical protein